jgi:hypothetical protein
MLPCQRCTSTAQAWQHRPSNTSHGSAAATVLLVLLLLLLLLQLQGAS